ncbi:MAG: pantoate--beta-alanine ligase [Planctomycetes bacterium]|nr:pantoate--beta-alanine ligase [Planctomycetota bacterium]
MRQCPTIADQRAWTREQRQAARTIGFVPTMGALHEGHLTLVRQAKKSCATVVVSIFVNPTQFDRPEDFDKYPNTLAQDLALLEQEGVDAVFLPTKEELYPNGFATFVEVVGPLTDKLCAIARPGHFRGVSTVVAKLFNIVQPDVAVFGQKDLQQVLIVGRMVQDLDIPVRIEVGLTKREPDGLAMSSRNRRLSPAARKVALSLPRALELANRAFKSGEHTSLTLTNCVGEEILTNEGTDLDYADVIKLDGFKEVEFADEGCILAAAVFVDGVRLIDHVMLGGPSIPVIIE